MNFWLIYSSHLAFTIIFRPFAHRSWYRYFLLPWPFLALSITQSRSLSISCSLYRRSLTEILCAGNICRVAVICVYSIMWCLSCHFLSLCVIDMTMYPFWRTLYAYVCGEKQYQIKMIKIESEFEICSFGCSTSSLSSCSSSSSSNDGTLSFGKNMKSKNKKKKQQIIEHRIMLCTTAIECKWVFAHWI